MASSSSSSSSSFFSCLLLLVLCAAHVASAAKPRAVINFYYQTLDLVQAPPLLLPYRNGPVLSGSSASSISIYLLWYGSFSPAHRATILDFFHSLDSAHHPAAGPRSVSSWWSTTASYRDSSGASVASRLQVAGQVSDNTYSHGKLLKTTDIEALLKHALTQKLFPTSSSSVYFVLTSEDVAVNGFCLDSCGYHSYLFPSVESEEKMLAYAWIGNSEKQCPGQCAWPFATPIYGPKAPPLRSPNGNVGIDGMVINIATVLAGAATNPFDTGYFQGDSADPLEAVSACTGIFGKGAYPGYPGELLIHNTTGASYNVEGVNDRRFLVPAMWNPTTLNCVPM